jgi:large subunit ribosomal protein L2
MVQTKYCIIDFKRTTGIPSNDKSIEYDPNRTVFIALLFMQMDKAILLSKRLGKLITRFLVRRKSLESEILLSKILLGTSYFLALSCVFRVQHCWEVLVLFAQLMASGHAVICSLPETR